MGLHDDLLRGIYSYGFEKPSAIQQRSIRPLVDMRDTIAQAQSGTGKTAAFSIGLLQNITLHRACQAIILAPTRELAVQIEKVVAALGEFLGVSSFAVIGGVGMRSCSDRLRSGVQIVVGTPGRVLDMLKRGIRDTKSLSFFILDEADEMLSKVTPMPTLIPTQTLTDRPSIPTPDSDNSPDTLPGLRRANLRYLPDAAVRLPRRPLFCYLAARGTRYDRQVYSPRRREDPCKARTAGAVHPTHHNPVPFLATQSNPESCMCTPPHPALALSAQTLDGIKQYYVNVRHENYKFQTLCDL